MSEKHFNRGGIDQGLQEYLGLKGRLGSTTESTIQPAIVVRDLSDTPYARDGSSVMALNTGGAVVAELGIIYALPGFNCALQIEQIIVTHFGAGSMLMQLQLLSAANVAVLGAGIFTQRFRNTQQRDDAGVDWEVARSSLIVDSTPGAIGQVVGSAQVPVATSYTFNLGRPGITLYAAPGITSRLGFAVLGGTNNTAISATFIGREWPLAG